jgi:hypothetical protein
MPLIKNKNKIWTIFAISLIILLSSLWWLNRTNRIESFTMNEDASPYSNIADAVNMRSQASIVNYLESTNAPRSLMDKIQLETYNPDVMITDKTIYVSDPTWTGISSSMKGTADYNLDEIATDILNKNPRQKFKWDKVFIDMTQNKDQTITAVRVPGMPAFLTNDACNKNGLLNSDFKEDICKTYAGNPTMIQEKCKLLSPENCKIPSCCVLIKGGQCVAGNQFGPTFVSENGIDIDFSYFYHKNECYGNCGTAQNYKVACGGYENSSTGISKECMVQMFNNYGCPNSTPDAFINDTMVHAYSQTSKQYVDDYIKKSVGIIRGTKTEESYKLCYGNAENTNGSGEFDNLVGTSLVETGLNFANLDIANASPDALENYTPPKRPA